MPYSDSDTSSRSPSTAMQIIKHPYAYDHPYRSTENAAYVYANLCSPSHELFTRDPYANMESFIPTISTESLPWLHLGEETLAKIVRLPRSRRVAKCFRHVIQAVRERLIYVRLPSQVQARFPKRCSTCDRNPVYYLWILHLHCISHRLTRSFSHSFLAWS